ncbi:MAG: isoprenylcysteine carboxylmethyltransferase family protein [Bacteroidales bacterium]|nr:isoprenylcysteine carboxylmethyltransferase family protein [Bacteroidales bacterium]
MALIDSFEKNGNFLFKYRGQIPIIVFVLGLLSVYFSDQELYAFTYGQNNWMTISLAVLAVLTTLAGMIVRAYTIGTTPHGTSGRNTDKQVAKQLNTKGIYSIVRHPLYLGNYLMWAGLLIFTMNLALFVIISLVYWIYYERIMFAEERFLEKEFGEDYRMWSMSVPAFFPKFSHFQKSDIPFSFKTVLRREYSGFFAATLGFVSVDYVRAIVLEKQYSVVDSWLLPSFYVLIVAAIITLVLRTLKHHSTLLSPDENRD